jgi:hypothetical protein
MALPNKPSHERVAVPNPEVEEREVDVLIVGGGMAACGSAFEIKKWLPEDASVLLVDKAALKEAVRWRRVCPPSTPMSVKTHRMTMSVWFETTSWALSAKT